MQPGCGVPNAQSTKLEGPWERLVPQRPACTAIPREPVKGSSLGPFLRRLRASGSVLVSGISIFYMLSGYSNVQPGLENTDLI